MISTNNLWLTCALNSHCTHYIAKAMRQRDETQNGNTQVHEIAGKVNVAIMS